ncbi:cupin domain-containing protein [Streptomyces sp. NPDC091027]|uniref:cupin domain-containing protein n=1 Tax=Streptomyces sp. NPDC091027 TaxID=3365971 RepID=UPI00382A43C3
MHVIDPAPENITATPNATMTGLAAPNRGSAELSTWDVAMSAGATGPEHSADREQVWLLLAGSLEVTSGGRTERVAAGRTLVLPAGALRRIAAPEDFRAYVAMRADGVVSVPGEEHPRELPWTR